MKSLWPKDSTHKMNTFGFTKKFEKLQYVPSKDVGEKSL